MTTKDIHSVYDFGKNLGSGKFSQVVEGRRKGTIENVAIKIIDKFAASESGFLREIGIMEMIKGIEGVIKLIDSFVDELHYFIVMELSMGGELFDKIVDYSNYSEYRVSEVMRQIVTTVGEIHQLMIIHRDLKPENILLRGEDTDDIVICDFGLAVVQKNKPISGMVGSSLYMAPEVAQDKPYDFSVDIYSIGVILYILLCGYPPFEPDEGIIHLEFPEEEWSYISEDVIELIKKMLNSNPAMRPSVEEILSNPWFDQDEDNDPILLLGTIKTIKIFNRRRRTGESMRKKDPNAKSSIFKLFDNLVEPEKSTSKHHRKKRKKKAGRKSTTVKSDTHEIVESPTTRTKTHQNKVAILGENLYFQYWQNTEKEMQKVKLEYVNELNKTEELESKIISQIEDNEALRELIIECKKESHKNENLKNELKQKNEKLEMEIEYQKTEILELESKLIESRYEVKSLETKFEIERKMENTRHQAQLDRLQKEISLLKISMNAQNGDSDD